ncbi:MAG: phosphoribosylamine--glycine ligase [Elusimicrobiota bacterium]|nr:phosphoribosylamine--glycine ligase [Elusimicrobiota bacterium]
MNVLIIGSGGREHVLCWKIKQSPLLNSLYALPGSAAISEIAECSNIGMDDAEGIFKFCEDKKVDIVIVGPEAPLAAGLQDFLASKGLKVFGPEKAGAKLEASKEYAKEFMKKNEIPTADFKVLTDYEKAKEEIKNMKHPLVIKADGLCAGKGVRICFEESESLLALSDFMDKKIFGDSGSRIVAEEFLIGDEASIMAFVDGNDFLILPVSRDHKRLMDNNEGPNTGGMGAVCPVNLNDDIIGVIKKEILERFIEGLKKENISYCGIIYVGLMFTRPGPKVLEFNVRFGDPEAQAVIPLIKEDLLEIIIAAIDGRIAGKKISVKNGACVNIVLSSGGYPENPEKGKEIKGLENFANSEEIMIFHSGTKKDSDTWFTNGGRVLNIAAIAPNIEEAREKVYFSASHIEFDGMHYRKDIGL